MTNVMLPRLMLIGDEFSDLERGEAIRASVEAGVEWVQLRDHAASPEAFENAADALIPELRALRPDVHISVNSRARVAQKWEAHLHVGTHGPEVLQAREMSAHVLGYSAHSLSDGIFARRHGANYITYSPVFRTSSKPSAAPLGEESLTQMCSALSGFPVFALGGITADRAANCLACGAHGVAVLSGILYTDDPAASTREYLSAISSTRTS